jgi:GST-like protein
MIKFHYSLAPNPMKVALFLEEAGLDYEPIPVDTRKGEQFSPELSALNPNNKLPIIQDGDITVFDSNAILLYLAEKTGKFLPENTPAARAELFSWLMFVATGIGPYSGQAVHFRHFAPEPKDYANGRYAFEAKRHYSIVDARLADRRYMLGDSYTIVDIDLWGWTRMVPYIMGEEIWTSLPNLKRWFDEISARPAAARTATLKDRHAFKAEFDEEARRHMFRHIAPAA